MEYKPGSNHVLKYSFSVFSAAAKAIIIILMFCNSLMAGPFGKGGPPPVVIVAPVSVRDVNPSSEYVGHMEAIQYVDLRARVEGFLEKVNFKEGDDVKAGDILYVIEQGIYKARVDADTARVAQAKALLYKADKRLRRLRHARRESVSATDLDNALAEKLRAKALLEEAKALLARSRLDLEYTIIKAPINGRIGKTAFTMGNLVNPASGPLARIVQLDPIRVVYSISENDLKGIRTALHDSTSGENNSMVKPYLKMANGEKFKDPGQVDFVDNQVDPATGTIAVRAVFENPGGILLPGQYVTVLIKKSRPKIMPVVPQSAVLVSKQGSYVLVVDKESKAVARPVITGPLVDGVFRAVESGLKPGEKIIVRGIQKVRPGGKVTVKPAGTKGK